MAGYQDFFRNMLVNYESHTGHDLAARYLYPKADMREAMKDHTYTKLPFGETG
jgi:hypothetical protein